jgi:hypothetical protein
MTRPESKRFKLAHGRFRLAHGASAAVVLLLGLGALGAQTAITPPKNKYTPAQDVQLGREAAAQVEKQLPILHDEQITSYAESIGRRLVEGIPTGLRHPEFRYAFSVVNVKEINAFALPGGPMYVNRGMMTVAHSEGEIAGVMAHELSHVALRHGTAQATKATKYEIGQMAGAVLGAIIGGRTGSIVAQGTQFGLGTAFLRFSREYERQADLLGSQIMAHVGYDPREMANVFKTIEKQGGSGGPQWLSDHPNPGDRYEYITREAQTLQVRNPVRDTSDFRQAQARLSGMSPAPSTEDATRKTTANSRRSGDDSPGVRNASSIESPSSRFKSYTEGNAFVVSVPSNWSERAGDTTVTFAPDGAYGTVGGQSVFTHGVEIGLARNETHDLRTATDELIASLSGSNPRLSRPSGFDRTSIGGRTALRAQLSNVSEATGQQEVVEVFTTLMRDGNLLYMLGVAPRDHFSTYESTFRKIAASLQIMK